MTQVLDSRDDGKNKGAVNRRRFMKRHKEAIKKAVNEAMSDRSVTDTKGGQEISIPTKSTSEPTFRHGQGGAVDGVYPGNKDFIPGDRLRRPSGGGGGGAGGPDSEQGEDNFRFKLSREEYLEIFFEGLALPNMVKKKLQGTDTYKMVPAGFSSDGIPPRLDVVRSLIRALPRRRVQRAPLHAAIEQLEKEIDALLADDATKSDIRITERLDKIEGLKKRLKAVPFIDKFDCRYATRKREAQPTSTAVMFCLMDVSGSMDETRKDLAKRFFTLMYLFLEREYKKIEVVYIRHHTTAKEVNEEEFFHSRETGGTVVSSALELMLEIIGERYSDGSTNIYCAQASDGDNWDNDSPQCRDILLDPLLSLLQYFAYVEIKQDVHQTLWWEYAKVQEQYPHFAMQVISDQSEIYPVFRRLFKKRETQHDW